MNHALKKAGGLIFQNFGWKLLALAMAVLVWAIVASEPEVATFVTVRVEYNHLPDNLEITAPVENVSLELKGPSGELRAMGDGRRPEVMLDVAGVGPGTHTFAINGGNVRLVRGVRLVRAIPAEIHLEFETHGRRTVPLRVRWVGAAPARYRIKPENVAIEGPGSHVDGVTEAHTEPVDASALRDARPKKVNVIVDDPYVRLQGPPQAVIEVEKK